MSDPTSDDEQQKRIEKYRRTAVLLHPRYPPHDGPPVNSRFGGLPSMPADYDWPRTESGIPLHFFAQVDCSEIPFRTGLPETGVLFFFGRDEVEQIWDDPAQDCRAVYAPEADAATPRQQPPDDLVPIGGLYSSPWREYLREGAHGPKSHVEWPLRLLPIDTWPDLLFYDYGRFSGETWQEAEARRHRNRDRLGELRSDAFTRATGERPLPPRDISQEWRTIRTIFSHAEEGPEAYPQHWLTVHYAMAVLPRQPEQLPPEIHSAGEEWLRRANEAGLDEPLSEEDRQAFRAWMKTVGRTFDSGISSTATNLVLLSLSATIRTWAADPVRAARVPAHVYETLHFYFSSFSDSGVHFSQMLGHAPSAQDPLDPDDSTIVLLNLTGSRAIGWDFGDSGYATFFIEPEDFANREFLAAWGTVEGY